MTEQASTRPSVVGLEKPEADFKSGRTPSPEKGPSSPWWNGRWYRLRMRLLHRFDLCWMQPTPLRDGDQGQWVNVWCHWCGVRGKRLDMDRAVVRDLPQMFGYATSPTNPEASHPKPSTLPVGPSGVSKKESQR